MHQVVEAPEAALESLSLLGDTDPDSAAYLSDRLERELEAIDRLQDAARVTPEDLRLHVSM